MCVSQPILTTPHHLPRRTTNKNRPGPRRQVEEQGRDRHAGGLAERAEAARGEAGADRAAHGQRPTRPGHHRRGARLLFVVVWGGDVVDGRRRRPTGMQPTARPRPPQTPTPTTNRSRTTSSTSSSRTRTRTTWRSTGTQRRPSRSSTAGWTSTRRPSRLPTCSTRWVGRKKGGRGCGRGRGWGRVCRPEAPLAHPSSSSGIEIYTRVGPRPQEEPTGGRGGGGRRRRRRRRTCFDLWTFRCVCVCV